MSPAVVVPTKGLVGVAAAMFPDTRPQALPDKLMVTAMSVLARARHRSDDA
jgi:hypothetical protein